MKALDSSVKRNTAVVKKLRQLTEESASSLMDDIVKTNQSKVRPLVSSEGDAEPEQDKAFSFFGGRCSSPKAPYPSPPYLFTLCYAPLSPLQYVSEAVASIAEAPLSVKDLPAALLVCGLLHRRYAEFGEQVGGGICGGNGLAFY